MEKVQFYRPFTARRASKSTPTPTDSQSAPHPPPEENKRIFRFLRDDAPIAVETNPPETQFFKVSFNAKSLRLFCSPFIRIRKI